jgi:Protein of unknown function (DUF3237)
MSKRTEGRKVTKTFGCIETPPFFGVRPLLPTLTPAADFLVEVGQPVSVGETAQGLRRVVPITGGTIRGARLNGTILNAGADFQIIEPDGFTRLEARYVARLTDGTLVYIENCGVRFGPAEVMARMTRGEPVDPEQIYFRTTPRFEVEGKAHQWLTRALFIALGVRHPDRVVLSVFEVG